MKIKPDTLLETLEGKKREGYNYLVKITATDYVDHIEVIYIIRNLENAAEEVVKLDLPSEEPHLSTIIKVYEAADWYERELSEMFGIEIDGRKARRLLLEKWDGKTPPLRKSYIWGSKYEGRDEDINGD